MMMAESYYAHVSEDGRVHPLREHLTPPFSSPCQGEEKMRKGGGVAGTARKDLEKQTGKKVVSSENYLTELEGRKRLERKK